jgi:hypothetical protein
MRVQPRDEYDRDIKILLKSIWVPTKFLCRHGADDKAYDTLKDADVDLTEIDLAEMKRVGKTYMVYLKKETATLQYRRQICIWSCRNKRFRLSSILWPKTNKSCKMDALMKRQDYNLDMYKKLMSTHHKLLLTSQSILQMLLTRAGRVHLYTHLDVVIKESHARDTVRLSDAIEERQV